MATPRNGPGSCARSGDRTTDVLNGWVSPMRKTGARHLILPGARHGFPNVRYGSLWIAIHSDPYRTFGKPCRAPGSIKCRAPVFRIGDTHPFKTSVVRSPLRAHDPGPFLGVAIYSCFKPAFFKPLATCSRSLCFAKGRSIRSTIVMPGLTTFNSVRTAPASATWPTSASVAA
jgi:hypothetical protein